MNITINKEYENLVPPLSDSEFQALKKSIKIKGMYMPIVVSDGIVLDGHHRFKIFSITNTSTTIIQYLFTSILPLFHLGLVLNRLPQLGQ